MSVSLGSTQSNEEARRAKQVEAAKKKLKSFRATRTSDPSSSQAGASSTSRSPRLPPAPLALSVDSGTNIPNHARKSSKGKERAMEGMEKSTGCVGHERMRSGAKASGRHRRQNPSISGPLSPAQRFNLPDLSYGEADAEGEGSTRRESLRLGAFKYDLPVPRDIITTPATPLVDSYEIDPFGGPPLPPVSPGEEDIATVKQRLSTFSFGSKPSISSLSVSPSRSPMSSPARRRRGSQSLLPSLALQSQDLNNLTESPPSSTSAPAGLDRLAMGTPSRPPSLLFTKATPLVSSPSAPIRLASLAGSDSPSTPPTPARKRHSHTRSNSISLSNLKLGGSRPISLGIPSSPSFPSSPCSPASPGDIPRTLSGGIIGTRLKFEPSEAEMAKEESRRKALEKLTGTSPAASPKIQEYTAEIALPDLEDDTSSTTSSRPFSSAWGSSGSFTFPSNPNIDSRPSSLTLPPVSQVHTSTPYTGSSLFPAWPADDAPVMSFDRWSKGYKEEGLRFGPEIVPKRGSFQGNLAVLTEEEETEEEEPLTEQSTEADIPADKEDVSELQEPERISSGPFYRPESNHESEPSVPLILPTPSKLKELHLLSSGSMGTPMRSSSSPLASSSYRPISPTKGYGTIGRGRPRPLSGIGHSQISDSASTSASSPLTGSLITPKTARMPRRRLSGSASGRRSSISYKKDKDSASFVQESGSVSGSSFSSRWSIGSKNPTSPPLRDLSILSSPPPSSPRSANWSHIPRPSTRPCPRPKSLVGLGIAHAGTTSNRILSEVKEKDELPTDFPQEEDIDGWQSAPTPAPDRPFTFRSFGCISMSLDLELSPDLAGRRSMESDNQGWGDGMLELELERDALREDVEGWRERCRGLEERLEVEKKESGVLRDRVRKLSDRLSTVSSLPPRSPRRNTSTNEESRLVKEMRDQLFNLTSAYERERRDKESAQQRLAELEIQLSSTGTISTAQPGWGFAPYPPDLPIISYDRPVTFPSPSTPIVTPATPVTFSPAQPESQSELDDNSHRMKSWGFPSARSPIGRSPPKPAPKPYNKRDSFFGLSKVPKQPEYVEELDNHVEGGVDLPPFVLPSTGSSVAALFQAPKLSRAVSEPLATPSGLTFVWPNTGSPGKSVDRSVDFTSIPMTKSSSASSFSNSALSLISAYIPGRGSPTKRSVVLSESADVGHAAEPAGCRGGGALKTGVDMRFACSCCVGEVFEL